MPKCTIHSSTLEEIIPSQIRWSWSIAPRLFGSFNVFSGRVPASSIIQVGLILQIHYPQTDYRCYTFYGDCRKIRMDLRFCLFLAFLHNCLASSSSICFDTMPSAIVAPAGSVSAIGATRTVLTTISSMSASSAPTSRTTAPPLTYNRFGFRRQECFNDQGFRVNCATWTGYYYTWGPPGNPYEGGPGEGGGSGGEGSGYTTVVVGGSSRASIAQPSSMLWLVSMCVVLVIAISWS